jgi:hypothetical protein
MQQRKCRPSIPATPKANNNKVKKEVKESKTYCWSSKEKWPVMPYENQS